MQMTLRVSEASSAFIAIKNGTAPPWDSPESLKIYMSSEGLFAEPLLLHLDDLVLEDIYAVNHRVLESRCCPLDDKVIAGDAESHLHGLAVIGLDSEGDITADDVVKKLFQFTDFLVDEVEQFYLRF